MSNYPKNKCVICGKIFEKFRESPIKRGKNRNAIKRPFNAITCSKKCAREYGFSMKPEFRNKNLSGKFKTYKETNG